MIKTVKQACTFNPAIRDYRMAEGIEHLADLIADHGDGREFFARNYVTHGMEQLFKEGMLRLSGKSDQAVFELTQAMGGGKTHMMIHGDPTLGQQEGFVLFVRSVLFFLWLFVRRHGIRCCDESCTGIFPDDARGF